MKNNLQLQIQKYKLIIFDWDGTLVDSLGLFAQWDKLYVKKFYDIDLPIEYFEKLARKIKVTSAVNCENQYFRFLDRQFGDGNKPPKQIWDDIYSLADIVQSQVRYKANAPKALKMMRDNTSAKLALATNSELRDMTFYSSPKSQTARFLSPLNFFDNVVTRDVITRPKPHPETFQKLIKDCSFLPKDVLIFEDSKHGVVAGKLSGARVAAIFGDRQTNKLADFVIKDWGEVIQMFNNGV